MPDLITSLTALSTMMCQQGASASDQHRDDPCPLTADDKTRHNREGGAYGRAAHHVMRIEHMGLFPTLRRGDYVIWQDVNGFVEDGLYVVTTGHVDQVYQVQDCGGRVRLLWPGCDIDPGTRRLRSGHAPQEIDLAAFARCCRGFVVASMVVHHEAALMGCEPLRPVETRPSRPAWR